VVVMAFDENDQAATAAEQVRICKRSYAIFVIEVRFPPEEIIFDPNVLTIGTGMEEHENYAFDFINATKTIKEQCMYVKITGGILNLSFGFRGVQKTRESIHAVFLHHGILESPEWMLILSIPWRCMQSVKSCPNNYWPAMILF
jgi:5-methyltetrahydrofolate--homocysteine methyltransferase